MRKICWAELSQYSHYMDFPSNTFTGRLYVVLTAKDLWWKLLRSSKNHENRESLAQQNIRRLQYNIGSVYTLTVTCHYNIHYTLLAEVYIPTAHAS